MTLRRILLADDTEDMRMMVRLVVAGQAQVVAEAVDGDEALALWRSVRPPDLAAVVLDQRMPGRTGLEVAAVILAEEPDQAVVLFSAHVDDEMRATASALGVTAVIDKSRPTDLLALACLAA